MSEGVSMISLNSSYREKSDFPSLKNLSPDFFWLAPTHEDIIEF